MKARHMLRLLFVVSAFALCAVAFSQQYRWVKADLHTHTAYSDAKQINDPSVATPATALDAAIGRGRLNVMAITDHGEWLTPQKWDATLDHIKTRANTKFIGLRGFEWTDTADWGMWVTGTAGLPFDDKGSGHINVFGTTEYTGVEAYNGAQLAHATGRNIIAFYDWLANRTEPLVVAQFNHPSLYDSSTHFDNFAFPAWSAEKLALLKERMALIEVTSHGPSFNAWSGDGIKTEGIGSGDDPTIGNLGWYIKALQKGWRVAPVASSDAHRGGYGERTNTAILISADQELSEQAVLEALHARRTCSSENGGRLYFAAGNETTKKVMGSTLSQPPTNVTLRFEPREGKGGKVECKLVWVGADYSTTTELDWHDISTRENNVFPVTPPMGTFCCFAQVGGELSGSTISAPVWFPTVAPPKQAPVKSAPLPAEFVADFQLLKKAISVLKKDRSEVLKVMGEPVETVARQRMLKGFPQDPLRWIYRLKTTLRRESSYEYCVLEFDDDDRLFSVRFSYEFTIQFILGHTLINDIQSAKVYRGGYESRLAPRLMDIAPYLMPDIPYGSPTVVIVRGKDARTPAQARFVTSSGVTVDAFGVYTTYPLVHSRKLNAQTGVFDETDMWNPQVRYADLHVATIKIYAARPQTKLENWYLTQRWQKEFDQGVGYPKPIYIYP